MKKAVLLFLFGCSVAFSQEQHTEFTVYFETASAEIPEPSKTELVTFFSNESIDVSSLSVLGFCDDIGSVDDNLILSEERAKAVISLLKSYDLENISIKGKGEVALSENSISDETQRAKNRRATVSVDYIILPEKEETTEEKEKTEGYKTFDDDLKVGDKVIVKHLLFDGSRTSFFNPEEAESELMKIVDYFAKNPNVHFEIQGHVCCISNAFKDARNIETGVNNLSKARAEKIYNFFLSKGVSKDRMTHQGYGRQFPRKDVMESYNKRVEIVITKI